MGKLEDLDIDEIIQRKESGETYRDIAKELGVPCSSLSRWVNQQTGSQSKYGKRAFDEGKVKALYRRGGIWTIRAIAGDMSTTEEKVLQIVKELARRGELILREEDRDG